MIVIEMNPRVSRSSALASKATGFPIAKVAAKLAVGYTLDEIANDITGGATPASFEPTIDYVVTKIPRFAFEKFPGAEPILTTAMKSVGEAMAIGRNFAESLQKALRSLETGLSGLDEIEIDGLGHGDDMNVLRAALGTPTPDRLLVVGAGAAPRHEPEEIHEACKIDPWFIARIEEIVALEARVRAFGLPKDADNFRMLKFAGFSDARLATLAERRRERGARGARERSTCGPSIKRIDTCAAEFASPTAYMYSTYETPFVGAPACEARPSDKREDRHSRRRPEPHRSGHRIRLLLLPRLFRAARRRLRDDHDQLQSRDGVDGLRHLGPSLFRAADGRGRARRFCDVESSNGTLKGVIVQYGGQTPLKLAHALEQAGVPILGTPVDSIDLAEDRDRFKRLLDKLGLKQPKNGIAYSVEQSRLVAGELGLPLVVRPSYVLGGRAMAIIRDERARRLSARHAAEPRAVRGQGALSQ